MQIIKQYLTNDQYLQEVYPKKQIYLHHTAGNSDPMATIKDWQTDERGKIATAYVIGGYGKNDGLIIEAFDPKYWAWHLGVQATVFSSMKIAYQVLDKISIGIEICNWGQLTEKNGKYYNYVNMEIPKEQVCILDKPHRGFRYYHKYSAKQIECLKELLATLKQNFNVPMVYSEEMWDLSSKALLGTPGMYSHNNVRADKTDVSPQPDLISMLKLIK